MPCQNCGAPLAEGVAFCQNCGTPVPPSIAPTVLASQPSYGTPGSNPPSTAPNVSASQSPYGTPDPYTNYNPSSTPAGGQPYGAPPNPYADPAYNNPYGVPQPSNVPSYTPPPPSNASPYGLPQSGNVPSYGTPPPSGVPQYGAPQPGSVPQYAPGTFATPPVKRKSRIGLISGIVVAVLVIVIVGAVVLSKAGGSTHTIPSGNSIDSNASSIVTNIQMANSVDTDTAKPITLATTFRKNVDFYVTFQFDFSNVTINQQTPGYVEAKYYAGTTHLADSQPLLIDDSAYTDGYFPARYYTATSNGAIELYWCRNANCSDGKLAGVATFTVN